MARHRHHHRIRWLLSCLHKKSRLVPAFFVFHDMLFSVLLQHIGIAWKLGIRSHAMRALLAFGVFLLCVAFLAGAFSLRQPLVVTLDVGISGIRLLTALLTLFWMQEAFVRDIERRSLTLAFSLPVDRLAYVLGRFIGVMLLISFAVALWGIALAIADQFATWGYASSSRPTWDLFNYSALLFGIMLDAWVIGAFVLAVTSLSETSVLPFLVGATFALCARSIGSVLDYLSYSASVDADLKANFLPLVDKLRWALPDLGQLDWRAPILYGQDFPFDRAGAGLAIAAGYLVLFMTIAVLSYQRRELS